MTDDFEPPFETERERELWAATLDRLREQDEDPRAEQGLDRLADRILAEHRASAPPIALPLPPARRRTAIAIAVGLAIAATIAGLILSEPGDDDELAPIQAERTPERPPERTPAPAPSERATKPEPARVGPSLEQAALLTFTAGQVERTIEVAALVEPGARIEPGSTLKTASESETCLRWTAPFAAVCLEAGAEVELLAGQPSTRSLRLKRGRLIAVLDPLAPGQRFEVVTSQGSVSAIGTVFVVEVDEVAVEAAVFEGEVEVREGEALRRLRADQSSTLGVAGPVGELADEPRARAEAVSARAELWREPLDRMGAVRWGSARSVELDGHPFGAGTLALLLTAGRHHLHVAEGSERELEVEAGQGEALGELTKQHVAAAAAPLEQSAAELARLAQQARMARNYAETARLYRELIDRWPESPEATNVPVRLGDLLLKTGDQDGALAAYDRYLARGGQLEPDARSGRIKALRALGRDADEREAIVEFLREHADDYRVTELRERLAEIEL
ncbi:tetratricopeptide repeat protein [Nannocystaceae bacterium ST9]